VYVKIPFFFHFTFQNDHFAKMVPKFLSFFLYACVPIYAQVASYSSQVWNTRYCEILIGYCPDEGNGYALTFSTYGLNNCPESCVLTTARNPQLWEGLAFEWGATIAQLNGPRYWTMNAILDVSNTTKQNLLCFQAHYVANISLSASQCKIGSLPFQPHSVKRDTVWQYNFNQRVYSLKNIRDRKTYIMQSYSEEVMKLDVDLLPFLPHFFSVPPGWRYESEVLRDSAKLVASCGLAEIVQDPLKNTYQLVTSSTHKIERSFLVVIVAQMVVLTQLF
jgi:hypothetical protein